MANLPPVVFFLLSGTAIAAFLVRFIGRYRPRPVVTPLTLLMFGVMIWTMSNACEIAASTYSAKVFFSHAKYIGITAIPAAWLAIAMEYVTNEIWLTPRRKFWLAIEPTLTIALAFTSTYHDFFRHGFALAERGGYQVLIIELRPLFWVHTTYSYALLLAGTIVFIKAFVHSPRLYRGQIALLLVAALTPWGANVVNLLGIEPLPGLDLTPLAFMVTGLATAWCLYRYRLVDIVPVARATILEQMNDAVFVLDQDDRIVDINPVALNLMGLSANDTIGKPISQLLTTSHALTSFLLNPDSDKVVIDGIWRDQERYFDSEISTLRNRASTSQGCIVVLRDITEQKQTENELRTLIEAMDDVILILDKNGQYLQVQSTENSLLARPKNELLGKTLHDIFPQTQAENFLATIHEALESSRTIQTEYELSLNSEITWFHASVSPLHHNAVIWVARDITARKYAELRSNAFSDELKEQVKNRTAQLEQEIAARKLIEEDLKRSLGEKEVLLQEIHHRVKNNMQIISSLLRLQASALQDQRIMDIFADSQHRIRSMALVHEQLYQSQNLASINLADYVRSLTKELNLSYRQTTPAIQIVVEAEDIQVDIDTAVPCGLIINELVSNALKHAFPVPQQGEVRVKLLTDGNERYTVIVQDNGVGLPKNVDFQHTTSLGLQLVNSLSNQLQGTLELHQDEGTMFVLTFGDPPVDLR